MSKLSELGGHLTALSVQLDKAKTEIVARISALEDALAAVDLPAEAQQALDDLMVVTQALDDVVPDATPPAA